MSRFLAPISMQNQTKTLICLATYNERENLPRLVPRILDVAPDADVLVVDDNSPDGTGDWCDEFAQSNSSDSRGSHLLCIHRSGKLGLGTAAIEGIRFAIENEYELLVNLDADLSHSPEQIPDLIAALNEHTADVAVGTRYAEGGGIEGWPWRRRMSSRIVNWLARIGLGLNLPDCSGSFRCYRVDTLRRLNIEDQLTAVGYSFYEEILLRLAQHSAKFVEVPITFVEREHGVTKLGYAEAIQSGMHVLRLALATRLGRKQ